MKNKTIKYRGSMQSVPDNAAYRAIQAAADAEEEASGGEQYAKIKLDIEKLMSDRRFFIALRSGAVWRNNLTLEEAIDLLSAAKKQHAEYLGDNA
jgi:succinate dehydrogenase/fumarate reductase flavoprotein subunit